jgi:uncharacterized membrane protein HdeD (DUF308 family)
MSPLSRSESVNPAYEDCLRLHHCWGWFLALGVVILLAGVMAVGSALIATLASVLLLGCLLLGGGVAQIVNAFLARSWRVFFLYLLGGVLHLVVGLLMIEHPIAAAAGLTLMLAAIFFVGGILRIAYALVDRFPGWGWVLLNGFVTLVLGVAIWRQWPESSFWVIGLFVGIDLIFNGVSWIMLGLILRAAGKQTADAAAGASAPAKEPEKIGSGA